jgi:hypothetical protein
MIALLLQCNHPAASFGSEKGDHRQILLTTLIFILQYFLIDQALHATAGMGLSFGIFKPGFSGVPPVAINLRCQDRG